LVIGAATHVAWKVVPSFRAIAAVARVSVPALRLA
jgi:hypothetical protein